MILAYYLKALRLVIRYLSLESSYGKLERKRVSPRSMSLGYFYVRCSVRSSSRWSAKICCMIGVLLNAGLILILCYWVSLGSLIHLSLKLLYGEILTL